MYILLNYFLSLLHLLLYYRSAVLWLTHEMKKCTVDRSRDGIWSKVTNRYKGSSLDFKGTNIWGASSVRQKSAQPSSSQNAGPGYITLLKRLWDLNLRPLLCLCPHTFRSLWAFRVVLTWNGDNWQFGERSHTHTPLPRRLWFGLQWPFFTVKLLTPEAEEFDPPAKQTCLWV